MRCPKIHIGRIASGVTAMKSGEHRDRVAAQLDVIAFETEGASAWDEVPIGDESRFGVVRLIDRFNVDKRFH
ncbi:pfs domain-containing protein [Colletotrichum higginsianum]|uniref:Pfs domain-containing protein n=1 Tax=Colletotrichum higginsianum (strain IMI 349063) TaxID=759273 RepID=H1VY36_COLHI|nr:pfs domain-containing protein [Colletotrichum higginsianum]